MYPSTKKFSLKDFQCPYVPKSVLAFIVFIVLVICISSFVGYTNLLDSKALSAAISSDDLPGLLLYVDLTHHINELVELAEFHQSSSSSIKESVLQKVEAINITIAKLIKLEEDNPSELIAVKNMQSLITNYLFSLQQLLTDPTIISSHYQSRVRALHSELKGSLIPLLNNGINGEKRDTQQSLAFLITALKQSYFASLVNYFIVVALCFLSAAGYFASALLRQGSIERHVVRALNKKQIKNCYQLLINPYTKCIVGVEVLSRWQKGNGTWVLPGVFIPILAKQALLNQLLYQQVEQAIRDLAAYKKADPHFKISFNISAEQFSDIAVCQFLCDKADTLGGITIEVTEDQLLDFNKLAPCLGQFKNANIIIAIDDFGTGYSSLSYLQKLPHDIIKIDRMFVNSIGSEAVNASVLKSIIDLAKKLDKQLVAEGVETQQQADYLLKHGVTVHQGWLYAKALPFSQLDDYIKKQSVFSSPLHH